MGNITFHTELDNYKKKGTSNIQIRVTPHRKAKRITIGVSVLAEHWNPKKGEVRKYNPKYRQINAIIRSRLVDLERSYLK
jgi:hypothetical protein